MKSIERQTLFESARAVLTMNDAGTHTQPSSGIYPHQWLWDSCFIAIGIARYNPQRAAQEMYSLLQGQWTNGMVPHMIFARPEAGGRGHNLDGAFWDSKRSPHAPQNMSTSGITQPPVIADACLRIAQSMEKAEGDAFLQQVFPRIVAYHRWLYAERDPDGNGIVALFHPWETGLDNAPTWMSELELIHTPLWIRAIEILKLDWIIEKLFRRDIKHVKSDERMSTTNALRLTHVALGLRKRNYNTTAIMRRPHFVIESLSFNAILVGNNAALGEIAKRIGEKVPMDLQERFDNAANNGLQSLWSDEKKGFTHRNYLTGEYARIEGIAKLLPLYAGSIPKDQAEILVAEVRDTGLFGAKYPLPSVSMDSESFNERKYWQGPSWVNTNWLVIQGLRKYGYNTEANHITETTLGMVHEHGCYEYFNPNTGEGLGAENFSWTAGLVIDLLY